MAQIRHNWNLIKFSLSFDFNYIYVYVCVYKTNV